MSEASGQESTACKSRQRYYPSKSRIESSFTCSSASLAPSCSIASIGGLDAAFVSLSTGELASSRPGYTTRNLHSPNIYAFHVRLILRECRSIMSEAYRSGLTRKRQLSRPLRIFALACTSPDNVSSCLTFPPSPVPWPTMSGES
jgi:hypothetical protein